MARTEEEWQARERQLLERNSELALENQMLREENRGHVEFRVKAVDRNFKLLEIIEKLRIKLNAGSDDKTE